MSEDIRNTEVDISASSRLIAEISVLKELTDLLYEPKKTEFDGYVSVDDVYCSLRFLDDEAGIKLYELCSTVQCDEIPEFFDSNKPNAWRYLHKFKFGDSSVRLGIFFNDVSGKIIHTKGFIQFNPNKIKDDPRLEMLFAKIRRFTRSIELKRYDIAVDIPVSRENCRMSRDKRGYEYINHGYGITEYLGQRNKAGRVKLYDKTKESGVSDTVTRLEFTCEGDWSIEKIKSMFPKVYTWFDGSFDTETRAWVKAVGVLAALAIEHDEQIDFALDMLSPKARRKVDLFLASPCLEISNNDLEYAMSKAQEWRNRIEFGSVKGNASIACANNPKP